MDAHAQVINADAPAQLGNLLAPAQDADLAAQGLNANEGGTNVGAQGFHEGAIGITVAAAGAAVHNAMVAVTARIEAFRWLSAQTDDEDVRALVSEIMEEVFQAQSLQPPAEVRDAMLERLWHVANNLNDRIVPRNRPPPVRRVRVTKDSLAALKRRLAALGDGAGQDEGGSFRGQGGNQATGGRDGEGGSGWGNSAHAGMA